MLSAKKITYASIGLILMAGAFAGSTLINQEQISSLASRLGLLGAVFIVLLFITSHIFAPFSSIPFTLISIQLYGFGKTLLLFYIACIVSSVINFWIARKYGKRLVSWLAGEKNLHKIEELSAMNEKTLLVTARIFGYYWFDMMSYSLGLTNIKFIKYFIYTAVLTIAPLSLQYIIFKNLNFNSIAGIIIYIGSIAIMAAIFIRVFYKISTAKS